MGGGHSSGAITLREREVLGLVVAGCTNKQIAAALLISESTVKLTIGHLCQKLGASNRIRLAVAAVRQRLVDEAEPSP